MKKIALVSCDEWKDKIREDKNLKYELKKIDMDAEIISWQSDKDLDDKDLFVLRSVWGYQNNYKEFRDWLIDKKNKGIPVLNTVDMILDNIDKEKQFEILSKNGVKTIDTYFINNKDFDKKLLTEIVDKKIFGQEVVLKPTISGSGDNTFLCDESNIDDVFIKLRNFLDRNQYSNIIVQPYVKDINNGEYSCIFIDGVLTHTMLRFPGVFSDKKDPNELDNVPEEVLLLAHKVESLEEFKDYSYMRVDMVMDEEVAKIMEVELADPDLLTNHLEEETRSKVVKRLAKTIKGKVAKF